MEPSNKDMNHEHIAHRVYKCDQCGIEFSDMDLLQIHLKYLHTCHVCTRNFANPRELTKHVEIDHLLDFDENVAKILNPENMDNANMNETASGQNKLPETQSKVNNLDVVEDTLVYEIVTEVPEAEAYDMIQPLDDFIDVNEAVNLVEVFKSCVCDTCGTTVHGYEKDKYSGYGFECECKKVFINKEELEVHLRELRNDGKFTCDLCKEAFTAKVVLRRLKDFDCDKCVEKFHQKSNLEAHVKDVHEEKNSESIKVMEESDNEDHEKKRNFECQQCGKAFVLNAHLKLHVQKVHDKKRNFACDTCGKTFYQESHLKLHLLRGHKEGAKGKKRNFACDTCGKTFFQEAHLKLHVKGAHEKKRNLTCEECGKTFIKDVDLKFHMEEVHEIDKTFACKKCDKKFFQKAHLESHVEEAHEKKRKFSCTYCDKKFDLRVEFNAHVQKIHEKKMKFSCDHCDKRFYLHWHLMKHVHHYHERKFKFPCDICDKVFNYGSSLKNHLNVVHKQKRDFICELCTRAFTTQQRLKEHVVLIHEKRRDFSCEICENTFATPFAVKVHVRFVHEAELLDCDQCGRTVKSKRSMGTHLKVPHDVPCKRCDKIFISKVAMRTHVKIAHAKRKKKAEDKTIKEKKPKQDEERAKSKEPINGQENEHGITISNVNSRDKIKNKEKQVEDENVQTAKKKLECETCEGSFSSKYHRKDHMKDVHNHKTKTRRFACNICAKSYFHKASLYFHVKTVHEGRKDYICSTCGHAFPKTRELQKHLKKVEHTEPCTLCEMIMCSKAGLRRHLKAVHSRKKNISKEMIQNDNQTENLQHEHSNDNNFSRELSHSQSQHVVKVHEKKRNVQKNYTKLLRKMKKSKAKSMKTFHCQNCKKVFYKVERLKRHEKTFHEKKTIFKCGSCGKEFCFSQILRQHVKKCQIFRTKPEITSSEGSSKRSESENDSIISTPLFENQEEQAKNLICDYCDKEFDSEDDLIKHVLRQCFTCMKSFHSDQYHVLDYENCTSKEET